MYYLGKNHILILCLFAFNAMAERVDELQVILSDLGERMYVLAERTGNKNNEIQETSSQSAKQIAKLFEDHQIAPDEYKKEFFGAVSLGNKEIVSTFLDNGFDPNEKNESGQTPLMAAALRGNVDVVEVLLARGAKPNLVDNEGMTAVDFARRIPALHKKGGWGAISAIPIMVIAYAKYKSGNPFEKCEALISNHGTFFGWLKQFLSSIVEYFSSLYSRFV